MLEFNTQIDDFLFRNLNITSNAEFLGACFVMGLLAFGYEGIRVLRLILFHRAEDKAMPSVNGERTRLQNGPERRFSEWVGHNTIQSALHMVQAVQNYTIMLAVMTFNAWLLISVILGAAVGYFLMAPFSPPLAIAIRRSDSNGRSGSGVKDYNSTRETPVHHCAEKVDEETRFFEIGQQDARK